MINCPGWIKISFFTQPSTGLLLAFSLSLCEKMCFSCEQEKVFFSFSVYESEKHTKKLSSLAESYVINRPEGWGWGRKGMHIHYVIDDRVSEINKTALDGIWRRRGGWELGSLLFSSLARGPRESFARGGSKKLFCFPLNFTSSIVERRERRAEARAKLG